MKSVLLLLVTLLVAAVRTTDAQVCAGAGYDVSSAAVDMSVTMGGYQWILHPCGSISASYSALCANTTIHPYGSSLCQVPTGQTVPTISYNVAVYNTSVAANGVTWMVIPGGVQYSVQDGDMCGIGAARETTVQFMCNTTATTPWFASATEPETCWYTAVVHTASACTPTGSTTDHPIGTSFLSNVCGGGIYDLSSLNRDFYYRQGSYHYMVHPCGLIANASCGLAQPTSFCQRGLASAALPVDVSHWNASQPQIWSVTPWGLSVNIRDGAGCAAIGNGVPRQGTIYFNCNPWITSPILSFVVETEICHYRAVIQTPAVCSANNANANPMGYCGGAGYDLSAIQNYNLYWNAITPTGGGWQWYVAPCGQIGASTTSSCAGKQSMLCQIPPNGVGGNSAASWNASVAQSSVTWVALANGNGVQYSVQDGDMCGIGAPRETTVQFLCDTSAVTPYVAAINETETCWYTVQIYTTFACYASGPRYSHTIGSSYYDNICGGEVYDFSNIQAQGDLLVDTNPSNPTDGYIWYIDLCGRVQSQNCSSVQPTMMCQKQKAGTSAYSAGFVDSNTPVLYTLNSNGMTMSFQDGTPCGGIPFRQASITIICDGTTPAVLTSVREIETCHYAASIRAQCNLGNTPTIPGSSSSSSSTGGVPSSTSSSRVIPPVTFCGGAGYDVTSVAQRELSIISGGYTWTLRPCSIVSSACTTSRYGAMLCQTASDGVTFYVASVYNATNAAGATWLALPNGVQMSIQDGDMCGIGAARETTIQFICNATATTPWLASVTEIETCWYTAVIHTTASCNAVGPTGANGVGSTFYSSLCGGGLVPTAAFSSALNRDFYYKSGTGFAYWVHPCGTVTNSTCSSVQPSSFCQAGSVIYDVSHWNASLPQIWTITPTGSSVNIRDGSACGAIGTNVPRQATIEFMCNPAATTPIISYVSETEICHYKALIQTSAACTANNANANPMGYCGGAGYDFTALQGQNLYFNNGNWQWYLAPCGQVLPTTTTGCAGKQSMLCQLSLDGQTSYNAASWNASVARSGLSWVALPTGNGVQYSIQDGDMCGVGAPREVTVRFVCDSSPLGPYIYSAQEVETCWYTVEVRTIYACTQVATPLKSVGYSFYSTLCGGGVFDFTNIRNQGDLVFDSIPSSPNTGFMYYIDLCGTVQQPRCSTVQPTMFCQTSKSDSTLYSAAMINSSTSVLYTLNSNGLTMSVQDGTPCGGIPSRQASVTIICDGTSPAVLVSVRETETCHYAATIRAQCNYIGGSSFTGINGGTNPNDSGSSSSSSLSGGAIAGIVIGTVVGAAILLAVLVAVCCGALGSSKKTSGEGSYGGGAGKYSNQVEESSVEQSSHQGEVEMEETA